MILFRCDECGSTDVEESIKEEEPVVVSMSERAVMHLKKPAARGATVYVLECNRCDHRLEYKK